MTQPGASGLFKAGSILVLVGAILSAVGAVFLALAGTMLLAVGDNVLGGESEPNFGVKVVGAIYLGMAVLIAVGCVFGFRSYAAAKRGDVHAAWVNGLVCALLPPLQVIPLVGAILLLVSPEHEAWKARGATS
jgi:hypothetical protein